MAELPIRRKNVDLDRETNVLTARGTSGKIEFLEGGSYEDFPGLSWVTYKFEDIDASEKDGALGTLEPGARMPIELVRADKTFSQVPLSGEMLFLHVSPEMEITAYHVNTATPEDCSFLFEVRKGDFFCWINLSKDEKAQFLEYEEPGFTPEDLGIEEKASGKIAGTDIVIPQFFRDLVLQAEQSGLEDLIPQIIELDEEI